MRGGVLHRARAAHTDMTNSSVSSPHARDRPRPLIRSTWKTTVAGNLDGDAAQFPVALAAVAVPDEQVRRPSRWTGRIQHLSPGAASGRSMLAARQ